MGPELEELQITLDAAVELVTPGIYRVEITKPQLDLLRQLVDEALEDA